jgi:hypothetical protein
MNLWKICGKCYLKRSSPSFEMSPLKCSHYLEAPVSEAAFSTMNIMKSRIRNHLDNSLESYVRLSLTGLPIDIDKLAAQKQAHSSSSSSSLYGCTV